MKALVLLSGGLDSSVLLASVVKKFGAKNVTALNMYYGQKHAKEQEYAKWQASWHGVKLLDADLSEVFKFDNSCPLLAKSEEEIPTESYAEQLKAMGGSGIVKTYIPFRNGLFLSYATAVALQIGASYVYYGAHADDATGGAYPDCTNEFIAYMGGAINTGTGDKVYLEAPFRNMNKTEIVALGKELGVIFARTWSCYVGGDTPCGKCATCIDRKAAMEANGLEEDYEDGDVYANDITGCDNCPIHEKDCPGGPSGSPNGLIDPPCASWNPDTLVYPGMYDCE